MTPTTVKIPFTAEELEKLILQLGGLDAYYKHINTSGGSPISALLTKIKRAKQTAVEQPDEA